MLGLVVPQNVASSAICVQNVVAMNGAQGFDGLGDDGLLKARAEMVLGGLGEGVGGFGYGAVAAPGEDEHVNDGLVEDVIVGLDAEIDAAETDGDVEALERVEALVDGFFAFEVLAREIGGSFEGNDVVVWI